MARVKTNFKTARPTYFKEWRKYRNLTLERLAERIDVTAGAISQLENNQVSYTQGMLEALADALQCEPADLLIRDPSKSEAMWSIYEQLDVTQKKQAIVILKALLDAA